MVKAGSGVQGCKVRAQRGREGGGLGVSPRGGPLDGREPPRCLARHGVPLSAVERGDLRRASGGQERDGKCGCGGATHRSPNLHARRDRKR